MPELISLRGLTRYENARTHFTNPGRRKRFWRRRADSNRRIEGLQTPALDRLATSPKY